MQLEDLLVLLLRHCFQLAHADIIDLLVHLHDFELRLQADLVAMCRGKPIF
jgi:hypothetical protein